MFPIFQSFFAHSLDASIQNVPGFLIPGTIIYSADFFGRPAFLRSGSGSGSGAGSGSKE